MILNKRQKEKLELLGIDKKDGCGCYIGFTDMDNLGGVNEMELCGLRDYKYHKDIFFQCKDCKMKINNMNKTIKNILERLLEHDDYYKYNGRRENLLEIINAGEIKSKKHKKFMLSMLDDEVSESNHSIKEQRAMRRLMYNLDKKSDYKQRIFTSRAVKGTDKTYNKIMKNLIK